ncbi:MAG: UDP-N-acetylmuramate dehydrogenase [Opitutales bacterium]|nr:UDP-N-acetylmuramate dehydrogenase [Opitutales bacterium]MBT5813269.1 UDP-N-acetylmuramate dehydrogenase [Opitutales bacterium]MBT6769079.1 UDP-N-acetylmuramate dehydrogenase [Opitutales bacterium]
MKNLELSELPNRVHFVGISGAGMLPLALCMKQAGFDVSGEDETLSTIAHGFLDTDGIAVSSFELLEEEALLVRSSAIGDSHPAMTEASHRNWKTIRRGECLAALAQNKKLIAISGSHGKTTTCGMLIDLFEQSGERPSYVLGGLFSDGKAPGAWSDSEWLIAELDESDGTIDLFSPEITLILNADLDHHSRYPDEEAYQAVFKALAARTNKSVIAAVSLEALVGREIDIVTYPNFSDSERIETNQFGAFNQKNIGFALAAFEAAGLERPKQSFIRFNQIRRRQNILYFSSQVVVLEDYAHHPKEIQAIAQALAEVSSARKIVVFQPHRYSRTKSLKSELVDSLAEFDLVYLMDVYAASEELIPGGNGEDLYLACKEKIGDCRFFESDKLLISELLADCANGADSVVTFLGAGRTDVVGKRFAEELKFGDRRWGNFFYKLAPKASFQSRLRSNEPLARKTTLRVGGEAELYFEPSSIDELQVALRFCHEAGIPVYPLGRGSNLIVPDEGVSGMVIRLSHTAWKSLEDLGDGKIRLGAGMRIKELCGIACRKGLEGFEFLEGIPGSVGGALRMNAGAMGGWMFDVVESVRFATLDGNVIEASSAELEVGYRHCRELKTAIALDAVLKSTAIGQSETALREAIDVYQSKRKESQPREPSAGCIFKNPENESAGRLIEELGLKGTVVGGAEISETHGNFIINRGCATSGDVIELVKLARRVAMDRRSIELEPEALLYGGQWKEALS